MNSEPKRIEAESNEVADLENTSAPKVTEKHEDCTEAVDYVNQLIARMNGMEGVSAQPSPKTNDAESSNSSTYQEDTIVDSNDSQQETPAIADVTPASKPIVTSSIVPPTETVRQAQRPVVMAEDIQRLREAANISASGQLNSFETKNLYRSIYLYLLLAMGLITTSITLLYLSSNVHSISYYASVLATVAGILAAWKFYRMTNRLVCVLRHQDSHSLPDIPAI